MDKLIVASILMIALSFVIGAYFYPLMPEMMASHWGENGNVNGYMPRFWGIFMLPIIIAALTSLLVTIPRIDPLRKNILKFKGYYYAFIFMLTAFMTYIYVITLAWNLGYIFDFTILMIPAFSALFYAVGIMMGKAKRNWFIGIRTPWTLSSDRVWDRTHALGSKLFKASAIIALLGLVFRQHMIFFMIVPLLLSSAIAIVFSYVEYSKQNKKSSRRK
jgi:uncharacterized membrane protein